MFFYVQVKFGMSKQTERFTATEVRMIRQEGWVLGQGAETKETKRLWDCEIRQEEQQDSQRQHIEE